MVFYPSIHHPHIAHQFPRCLTSINTLRRRKSESMSWSFGMWEEGTHEMRNERSSG